MNRKEDKEILRNVDENLKKLTESQKSFLLGYMEGVTQRPEEIRKAKEE